MTTDPSLSDLPPAPPAPPTVDATPGLEDEQGWRQLSTRMLLIHPIQDLGRFLPVLVGVIFLGRSNGSDLPGSVLGLLIVAGGSLVRWATTTYRITPDQVQLRHGLLRRQQLSVPRDRVRTVDITAPPLHRLLGLVRLAVGTGQSDLKGGGNIRLDGLLAAEAVRLREELLGHALPGLAEPSAAIVRESIEEVLATFQPGWIRYGPFSISGLLTIGAAATFVWRIVSEQHVHLDQFGPVKDIGDWLNTAPPALAIPLVFLALLLGSAVASTAGYILTFGGFRLVRREGGTLQETHGLLTTRAITIEERRVRGVELSEPIALRAARGARCLAITTGLRVGRGAERGGSILFPPGPRDEALQVAAAVLRHDEPMTCPLVQHGPSARRRRFTRALVVAALLVGATALASRQIGLPAWVGYLTLLLLPLAALLAADRYRNLGHALAANFLVTQWGSWARRRWAVSCDGIIGWNIERSFFQRQVGLATLTATTAAGRQRYEVPDVPLEEALRLADEALPGLLRPFLV